MTAVCTEFTSEMLREWMAQGEEPVQELTKIREVDYVDLPTGHWPQLTRPEELARAVLASVDCVAPREPLPPAAAPPVGSPATDRRG